MKLFTSFPLFFLAFFLLVSLPWSCSMKGAEEKLANELSKRLEEKFKGIDVKQIEGAITNLSEKDRARLKEEGRKLLERL